MPILLVEVSLLTGLFDDNAADASDTVLDHMVRYLSHCELMPAITLSFRDGTPFVVRGGGYLRAAKVLNRMSIRAVVDAPTRSVDVNAFLSREDVLVLDWPSIRDAETRELSKPAWYVFFFARPLAGAEKEAFNGVIRSLWEEENVEVVHDDTGPMAEYVARARSADSEWAAVSFRAFQAFSRDHVAIVSFQGRRWTTSPVGSTDVALSDEYISASGLTRHRVEDA